LIALLESPSEEEWKVPGSGWAGQVDEEGALEKLHRLALPNNHYQQVHDAGRIF
jgi:hypothetical protein